MAEPKQLKRGKAFHKLIQSEWEKSAQGNIQIEETIELLQKPGMKKIERGRMDIYVNETKDFVSIVEIKGTNWDAIKPKNIQRNISSHRRQIWKYIEKFTDTDKTDVCAGIIYPKEPKTSDLKEKIGTYLNDYGIQVVWYQTIKQS